MFEHGHVLFPGLMSRDNKEEMRYVLILLCLCSSVQKPNNVSSFSQAKRAGAAKKGLEKRVL